MQNEDKVIEHTIAAIEAKASEVRDAFNRYVAAENPAQLTFARAQLRRALLALANGHEWVAHDGATRPKRVTAARAALAAWDGETGETTEPSPGGRHVEIAGRRLAVPRELVSTLYWGVGDSLSESDTRALCTALSEGLEGVPALLRAIAIAHQSREAHNARTAQQKLAELQFETAKMHLAAEKLRAER